MNPFHTLLQSNRLHSHAYVSARYVRVYSHVLCAFECAFISAVPCRIPVLLYRVPSATNDSIYVRTRSGYTTALRDIHNPEPVEKCFMCLCSFNFQCLPHCDCDLCASAGCGCGVYGCVHCASTLRVRVCMHVADPRGVGICVPLSKHASVSACVCRCLRNTASVCYRMSPPTPPQH